MRIFCLACALLVLSGLAGLTAWSPCPSPSAWAAAPQKSAKAKAATPRAEKSVYEDEAPTSARELDSFLEILPRFRAWARENGEQVHPSIRNGKADFSYSGKAAAWVQQLGWQPKRFFCVMGRMAAAMVMVEEGNDMGAARPADMPSITQGELDLARRNLGSLLRAGGDAPSPEPAPAVSPKKYPEPQQFAAPRYVKKP